MRCPDCCKFVSLETQDPEVENIEVTTTGEVQIMVRLVRACSECGTELKETQLEATGTVDLTGHEGAIEGTEDEEHEADRQVHDAAEEAAKPSRGWLGCNTNDVFQCLVAGGGISFSGHARRPELSFWPQRRDRGVTLWRQVGRDGLLKSVTGSIRPQGSIVPCGSPG